VNPSWSRLTAQAMVRVQKQTTARSSSSTMSSIRGQSIYAVVPPTKLQAKPVASTVKSIHNGSKDVDYTDTRGPEAEHAVNFDQDFPAASPSPPAPLPEAGRGEPERIGGNFSGGGALRDPRLMAETAPRYRIPCPRHFSTDRTLAVRCVALWRSVVMLKRQVSHYEHSPSA
jgi:hypothetical protein